jgi:hydrogenase maturation protein HypF
MIRKRLRIEGIVQGVGFRPFVYQLAHRLQVAGWVLNDSRGVVVEAEGKRGCLAAFLRALREELPPLAAISRLEEIDLPPRGEAGFVIRASEEEACKRAQIAPDTFVCDDCRRELFDPADRRYRYPFINCTSCGPRYSIVTGVPYDRAKTTMADFPLCAACRAEYEDPSSRRFHAQPNACPECGPRLSLQDAAGRCLAGDPVTVAVDLLRQGKILAVKGIGGWHLAVDAADHGAVAELRRRKARDEKPFALMSAGMPEVERYAVVDAAEQRLLTAVERPIVLLRQREGHPLSPLVAPRNRWFGVMLPCTPLHYLLLHDTFIALVMTSGNLSEEPIAFEDGEAGARLAGIADAFLGHDRRIEARTDDSIARVLAGRALLLRRSRGYVPRAVFLPRTQPPVLAVGGELKNTVCLTLEDRAYLSQHIGDLQNPETCASFERTISHLQALLDVQPQIVAHDLHPDYASSRWAAGFPGARIGVQHHHAHLASCLAENGITDEVIGVVFDGLGYGADGHLWGGEFLVGNFDGYRRAGHFDYLPMPGGDAATREPWRMAVSCLLRAYGEDLPRLPVVSRVPEGDLRLLRQMISRGINTPFTSSCGRLFDAVAALAGVRERVSYEGQAALELETAIDIETREEYPFTLVREGNVLIFQQNSLIRAVAADVRRGEPVGAISARFHNAIAALIAEACRRLRAGGAPETVALSGGVFQNRYLAAETVSRLQADGFRVLTHSLVPPNDGGLALGQAAVAGRTRTVAPAPHGSRPSASTRSRSGKE